MKSQAGKFGAA